MAHQESCTVHEDKSLDLAICASVQKSINKGVKIILFIIPNTVFSISLITCSSASQPLRQALSPDLQSATNLFDALKLEQEDGSDLGSALPQW